MGVKLLPTLGSPQIDAVLNNNWMRSKYESLYYLYIYMCVCVCVYNVLCNVGVLKI